MLFRAAGHLMKEPSFVESPADTAGPVAATPCEAFATTTPVELETLRVELDLERGQRRRAECFAKVQTDAVQLALDLLIREPDIESFFGVFTKTIVEDCESHSCGVWLIDED